MNPNSDISLLWIITCAFLVFMMQLGFAMVETGCVRSKNTINVAMKNLVDSTYGFIFFWIVGFGLMFGADSSGLFGTTRFMIDGTDMGENAFFFFQAMFATTAATIVSGAVAERMKFGSYVLTAIVLTSFIYPVFGHWAWGDEGWLKELGFIDFAGSTVVHSVGAWVGLAGAIVLGQGLGSSEKLIFEIFLQAITTLSSLAYLFSGLPGSASMPAAYSPLNPKRLSSSATHSLPVPPAA